MKDSNRDQQDPGDRPGDTAGGPLQVSSGVERQVDESNRTHGLILEEQGTGSKHSADRVERPDRKEESPREVPPARPGKRGKPDLEEFLEQLERAIKSKSPKDKLPALMKILKAGYKGEPSPDHIEAIFRLLRDWPGSNRLAIQLSLLTRKKRQPELLRYLRNRLISHSRERVDYPVADERTTIQESRSEYLMGWIKRCLSSGASDATAKVTSPDLEWTRWAIVCLMEEKPLVRAQSLYAILDAFDTSSGEGDDKNQGLDFLLEFGKLFASKKLPIQNVVAGSKLASAARDSERTARSELAGARSTIEAQNARTSGLVEQVAALEEARSAAEARSSELERKIAEKAREVEQEKEERRMDQQHWETVTEQRLARQANEVSGRFGHEIKEARLCLGDESPNIRMALDRLKQMEKWLSKLRAE